MRNSSNIFRLLLVITSCHEVDLELLSIVTMTPAPFACASVASIFCISVSNGRLISKYKLAIIILVLSTFLSKTAASSSESWFINNVSICPLLMTISALISLLPIRRLCSIMVSKQFYCRSHIVPEYIKYLSFSCIILVDCL